MVLALPGEKLQIRVGSHYLRDAVKDHRKDEQCKKLPKTTEKLVKVICFEQNNFCCVFPAISDKLREDSAQVLGNQVPSRLCASHGFFHTLHGQTSF